MYLASLEIRQLTFAVFSYATVGLYLCFNRDLHNPECFILIHNSEFNNFVYQFIPPTKLICFHYIKPGANLYFLFVRRRYSAVISWDIMAFVAKITKIKQNRKCDYITTL